MEEKEKLFCLEVWGDFACFTRPEMKVERVSYDVITPSAARAIFEAVLWKPAVRWHIREIEVLAPIKSISVRRNEVGATAGSGRRNEIYIEDHRMQRAGLLLRDVCYRIHAWLEYIPVDCRDSFKSGNIKEDENPGKYLAMFERRARNGQCFNQPYFGCREFPAYFELIDDNTEYKENLKPICDSRDLGFMLYDMDFSDPRDIRPSFFRVEMKEGKIKVPDWNSDEVKK